ncbi:uncharacterized protein LOC119074208 isoform X2 [Bradysia coprophila]|uniref:uncharacterized protein LOC119074208 isoform X2 n=1 Tax=Bradysia coprophila TaxID=38358 RepID=UPI00187D9812|nr:uncharacterized protein LOC119074208 isoform X2 [Bradysia coprophila]
MNQMCVNNIYANNNCNGYECFASIDNYSNLCKNIAVGENVTSNEFAMIFPNSVGESKWRLVFYPRGQYVGENVGDSIGIYLIMVSCELQSKTLKANVEFQLKSQTDASGPVKKVDTIFNFSIPSKRWIGEPNFVRKKWLNAKRRAQFCSDDCLVIRCLVEETVLESSVVAVKFPLEQTTTNVADDTKGNGNQIRKQNGDSEDPLERKCTTEDKAVDTKSKMSEIRLQNGHAFTDRKNNNDADWTVVGGKKGKNNQYVNQHNTRSNTDLSEPKNQIQGKRKTKSKKGGRGAKQKK